MSSKKLFLLSVIVSILLFSCAAVNKKPATITSYSINYDFPGFFVSPLDAPFKYKPIAEVRYVYAPAIDRLYKSDKGEKVLTGFLGYVRVEPQKVLEIIISKIKKQYPKASGIIRLTFIPKFLSMSLEGQYKTSAEEWTLKGIVIQNQ